jgi:hypothetical protein
MGPDLKIDMLTAHLFSYTLGVKQENAV